MRFNSYNKDDLTRFRILINSLLHEDTVIVCIGTNKYIADSLGPFVGSILKSRNCKYPIYGTINNPIHALNLEDTIYKIKKIHDDSLILAIDAAINTDKNKQGDIIFKCHSLKPGEGLKKELPSIGDNSILGIVGSKSDFENNEIFLDTILNIATFIADAITPKQN